jgi:hypothetical protein
MNIKAEKLPHRAYAHAYYIKNREARLKYNREWRAKHPEYAHADYINNKEKIVEYSRKWRAEHQKSIRAYRRKHRVQLNAKHYLILKRHPEKRVAKNLHIRILHLLKGIDKSASTLRLLGCSLEQFKVHLQSLFQPGMTLANHGKWQINHIRPRSSFNLLNPQDQARWCHYTNLQPIWPMKN